VKRNALPYRDNCEVLREHLDDETAALAYLDGPSSPERSTIRRPEWVRGVASAVDDDDDERGSRCRRPRDRRDRWGLSLVDSGHENL
jgi:hypothetical protein